MPAGITGRHLSVFLDGRRIGDLQQDGRGALRFAYDEEYRLSRDSTPLSLSMPLTRKSHASRQTRAFFDGLLPDNEAVRQKWASEYGASATNPFSLLVHVGRDAAGAVQVLPPDVASTDADDRAGDIEWLTNSDVAKMTHDLAQHKGDWTLGGKEVDGACLVPNRR